MRGAFSIYYKVQHSAPWKTQGCAARTDDLASTSLYIVNKERHLQG